MAARAAAKKKSKDISHEAGRQVTKRGGIPVVQHDAGGPFKRKKAEKMLSHLKVVNAVRRATQKSLKASGVQHKAGGSFPATDRSLADVQRANDERWSSKDRGARDGHAMGSAEESEHHSTLTKAGWSHHHTQQLGINNPNNMHVYTHPKRKGESIEVHAGVGQQRLKSGPGGFSTPHRPDVWEHRTPASGAGTGIRPVGGTSSKSLSSYLKKL